LLNTSKIEIINKPTEGDDGFLFYFVQVLDGVGLSAIEPCQECGKWFLQYGRRKRLFCSDLCRSRKGVREWRQRIKKESGETYKRELEKGKERAKASHRRKMGLSKEGPVGELKTTKNREHEKAAHIGSVKEKERVRVIRTRKSLEKGEE